jgi:hypothetical protein
MPLARSAGRKSVTVEPSSTSKIAKKCQGKKKEKEGGGKRVMGKLDVRLVHDISLHGSKKSLEIESGDISTARLI